MIISTYKHLARIAGVALLASAALAQIGALESHAAPALNRAALASPTYTSPYFSISYPAGWSPSPSQSSSRFTLATADRNAFVLLIVQPARNLGPNPMPNVLSSLLTGYGTMLTTPQYGSGTVQGVQVLGASAVVRFGNNRHVGILTVYLANYRQRTYIAAAGVIDTGSTAGSIGGQEAIQAQQILNTVRFR